MKSFTSMNRSVAHAVLHLKQTGTIAMYVDELLAIRDQSVASAYPVDELFFIHFFCAGLKDREFATALKLAGIKNCDDIAEKAELLVQSGVYNGFGSKKQAVFRKLAQRVRGRGRGGKMMGYGPRR